MEDGYPSIGCLPCPRRVAPGEDSRAGRRAGRGTRGGYAASATRHADFRVEQGRLRSSEDGGECWSEDGAPIGQEELAALEDLAFGFAADWLWYDEDASPAGVLERKHYADHGWTVAGANLRSERLLRIGLGQSFSSLPPQAQPLRERLLAAWARSA